MKTSFKLISLLIALLMALTVFVACGEDKPEEGKKDPGENQGEQKEPQEDEKDTWETHDATVAYDGTAYETERIKLN